MRAAAEPLRDRHVRRHRQQLRRRAARLSRAAGAMPCGSSDRLGLGRFRRGPKSLRITRTCRSRRMKQLVRVQNFGVSSDGFGAGEGQSLERPFGHANPGELLAWAFATAHFANRTQPGGTYGLDDYCTRDFANNIGAEIMGRNKFSPHRGPWENEDWQGWWGDEPPFHTPVFVLTHHPRP